MHSKREHSLVSYEQLILKQAQLMASSTERLLETRIALSAHLLAIIGTFKTHLPLKKNINILSLACGIPDEFLALQHFYASNNITVNFVGIDIDGETIENCTHLFQKFNNITLLTGDITN
ncbi:MAG: hypothetical protein PSV35_00520, partial [bacterium]|nr:hypothetical protein [bacterium]